MSAFTFLFRSFDIILIMLYQLVLEIANHFVVAEILLYLLDPTCVLSPRGKLSIKLNPPPEDCMKINVDASRIQSEESISIGYVIHDTQGRTIIAKGTQIVKSESQ